MRVDTRKLCVLAMLSALAFILAAYVRISIIPVVAFLRYDPKDVIIAIAGFIYGPLAAFAVTVVVSFVQMFTVSQTGYIGLFMNIIASTAFCCTAALIYKKNRTIKGALLGLIIGGIFATAVMMMWNYIVTPIFMNRPRAEIIPLLIPGFLPFNLVSNGLNAVLTILLYKRVKGVLQGMGMMPRADEKSENGAASKGIILSVLFIALTCVLWVLILVGVI